jgi:ribosomal protein L30E
MTKMIYSEGPIGFSSFMWNSYHERHGNHSKFRSTVECCVEAILNKTKVVGMTSRLSVKTSKNQRKYIKLADLIVEFHSPRSFYLGKALGRELSARTVIWLSTYLRGFSTFTLTSLARKVEAQRIVDVLSK